jgi:hypothetical protein
MERERLKEQEEKKKQEKLKKKAEAEAKQAALVPIVINLLFFVFETVAKEARGFVPESFLRVVYC